MLATASLVLASFALQLPQSQAKLPTEDPPIERLHPMLAPTVKQGPFAPSWSSLVRHPMPSWFQNAKVGLSAHWGPYCVPGWTPRKDTPYGVAYAEWYWMWMRKNKAVQAHHRDVWGNVSYDTFINGAKNLKSNETVGFTTKDFDADAWMRLFARAGVRYFFITAKHHDGFCIFDSAFTERDSVDMGPRRDLFGEMVTAARKHGIRIGIYYSFYEWFNPAYTGKKEHANYAGFTPLADRDLDGKDGEYVDDFVVPQIKELIDKYHPDLLCFDGEWEHGYPHWRARQILAYYYNQAAERGQEVVANDRYGKKKEGTSDTRGVYGDFYHVEYHADIDRTKPWSMWRGFGNSYGYNRNEHPDNILSLEATIRTLVDVVSDNGNIEFNLGPKADGTLATFETERLEAMGKWLSVNGESIYDTRKSPFGPQKFGRTTFSATKKRLYVHVYEWPSDGAIEVHGASINATRAWLLASPDQELEVTPLDDGGVRISLPSDAPDKAVSVVAVSYEGELASK